MPLNVMCFLPVSSILAVRYEDLCVAPLEAAHTIFSFLGYEALPTSVKR